MKTIEQIKSELKASGARDIRKVRNSDTQVSAIYKRMSIVVSTSGSITLENVAVRIQTGFQGVFTNCELERLLNNLNEITNNRRNRR